MWRALVILCAVAAFGAADPWAKVRELKSGTEIRIYKKHAKQPLIAKFDEADGERVLIVVKNEQLAVARDQIDRLDVRPQGSRVKKESRMESKDTAEAYPGPSSRGHSAMNTTTSSSVNIGSKPDFETLYRRPPEPAKKP